jgi:hypothetical protein
MPVGILPPDMDSFGRNGTHGHYRRTGNKQSDGYFPRLQVADKSIHTGNRGQFGQRADDDKMRSVFSINQEILRAETISIGNKGNEAAGFRAFPSSLPLLPSVQ